MKNDGFEFGVEGVFSFFHFFLEESGLFDFFRVGLFEGMEFRFDKCMAIRPPNKHVFDRVSLLFFYFAIWCIEHSIISLIIPGEFPLELVNFCIFPKVVAKVWFWGFEDGVEFDVGVGLKCVLFNFSFFESHHFELFLKTSDASSVFLS